MRGPTNRFVTAIANPGSLAVAAGVANASPLTAKAPVAASVASMATVVHNPQPLGECGGLAQESCN